MLEKWKEKVLDVFETFRHDPMWWTCLVVIIIFVVIIIRGLIGVL